jgi:uncharacterized circularly permuted ATP-grasp superfamily protein/uncharacterized alpha-E superfamily protein
MAGSGRDIATDAGDNAFAALAGLSAAHRAPAGHWDELVGTSGSLRPGWESFARAAGDLSASGMARAAAHVARQVHEHGASYNVYASPDGAGRPWSLDVLPLVVGTSEWLAIENGLRQLGRLFNAIAADLYGPATLLRRGVVPPAIVFRHEGFLRACHGARPAGGTFVHVAAFDLAHGPDGRWHMVGARMDTPSGLGYALENRAMIARLFPDALGALGIQSLAPFFNALQGTFVRAAPSAGDTAHVVILTPGPFNATYFEHAYLARECGWPLVQGADLVVRDQRVFLKTVSGLRPIDVIWRRVRDTDCDPLELRADSVLGVPGLVQAWRAGGVTLANAPGLGPLESPAWLAYLGVACDALLGESLEMPVPPVAATSPDNVVIQQEIPLSHAPVWVDGSWRSRPLLVRVFLVADGQGDYHLMPGGLTRVAGDDQRVVSGQRGGTSKDTWVQSAAPVADLEIAGTAVRIGGHAAAGERTTSSRSAEHLFWLGRYAERSENAARFARATLSRIGDIRSETPAVLAAIVNASRRQSLVGADELVDESLDGADAVTALERVLIAGLFDAGRRQGLAFNVRETRRVAGVVRERLSTDNWRVLNRLDQRVASSHLSDPAGALDFLDDVIMALVAIGGLEMAHMTRDHGWRFLSLGRHLERLTFVAETLDDVATAGATDSPVLLDWLLDLSDSLLTYRARHRRLPEWPPVVELLFFDERNPRSAMFQVGKIAKHVRVLPGAAPIDAVAAVDALIGRHTRLSTRQASFFDERDDQPQLVHLAADVAARVSDELGRRYFSHVDAVAHSTVAR